MRWVSNDSYLSCVEVHCEEQIEDFLTLTDYCFWDNIQKHKYKVLTSVPWTFPMHYYNLYKSDPMQSKYYSNIMWKRENNISVITSILLQSLLLQKVKLTFQKRIEIMLVISWLKVS